MGRRSPGMGGPPPRRSRRAVGIGLVLVLVMVASGFGLLALYRASQKPYAHAVAFAAEEAFVVDVHAALAARTAALAKKDEQAFLADVDPAKPALIAAQKRLFRNLIQLPLTGAAFRDAQDSILAFDSQAVPGAKAVHVVLDHRIRDADVEPVALSYTEAWIRQNGHVVVTAADPDTV
jgi:hypothetical protein